jgi:16S rRNA U516 pseudouridylate synthase RsuA-like enzyme
MQFITTQFELLSKRIALSGCCSRRQADEFIRAGHVYVNSVLTTVNQPVPDFATVTLNRANLISVIPAPGLPKLFILGKPRGATSSYHDSSTLPGLRTLINSFTASNRSIYGDHWTSFVSESLPEHFIPINHVSVNDRGLVLSTTDGDFANNLSNPHHGLLTGYRLKVSGTLASQALSGRLDLGKDVKVQIIKHSEEGCAWLKLERIERPKGPDLRDFLWNHLKVRVLKCNVESFGPYKIGDVQADQVLEVPVMREVKHLVPKREFVHVLVEEGTGKILSSRPAMNS